jgi:hypothetical protein
MAIEFLKTLLENLEHDNLTKAIEDTTQAIATLESQASE